MEDRVQIEAVLAGDQDAFSKLMDRYYAMVYRACLNMAGNVPDAEELAHDSFVEAYLKLGQLRDPERFGGWLKTLTLNVCRAWYRRNKQNFVELDEDQLAAVEEVTEDRSVYARMSHGLSSLSTPHRLVLVLHYYEELSYDEIARFLEISKGTVMSRLHRARQSLREAMEQMDEYQDIPAVPDDRFKEVVQAEIEVLLRMFHDEPKSLERLTVVLRKSPERLAELIATAEDPVANLAVLLPHLGGETIDMVLDACFTDQEPRASNAAKILNRYAARCGTVGHRDGMPDMASRDAYSFLDRLIAHRVSDEAKASVLLGMMEASEQACPAVLFINALVCYRDAAFALLMERFRNDSGSPRILQALVRTGRPFSEQVLGLLKSSDTDEQALGLIGLEAQARSLSAGWRDEAAGEHLLNNLRMREKWAPISVKDLGSDLLAEATAETVNLLAESPEIRAQAVRTLGLLNAGEYAEAIRRCLSDPDASTRLAAVFALSEIGDFASADALINLARDGGPAEQAASALALGRLRVARAEHVLVDMTCNDDSHVREAAVIALGEMGTVSSQVVLQELMRSGDRKLRKLAAKGAFGGVRQSNHEPSEVDKRLAEKRRKVTPVAHISPDAAIRFGLTELRSYDERDLTERIARVCTDYCATRRGMVELGLMTRANGIYEFTEAGKSVWRVEQFICERYLAAQWNEGDNDV